MDASTRGLFVVRGGAVGPRAALAATALNLKHRIALVCKVYPTRNDAVFAECSARAGTRRVECGGS
jgi:succinate dehydrogenase/fumarate reductase flavoprotein subunit